MGGEELTMIKRRMHPVALGNNAYQKFKWCNFAPSMNNNGKLAAAYIHYGNFFFFMLNTKWIMQ